MLWAKCLGAQPNRTSLVGCWRIHTGVIGMKSCPHPTSQWAVEELLCFVREMTTSIHPLPSRDLSGAGKHPCIPLRLVGNRESCPQLLLMWGKVVLAPMPACVSLQQAALLSTLIRVIQTVCENFLLCKTGSRDYCLFQVMWLWSLVLFCTDTFLLKKEPAYSKYSHTRSAVKS